MNIVVVEGKTNNPANLSWDALKRYGNLTIHDRISRDELAAQIGDADIVVSCKITWDAEAFALAPHLKMIALTSTGYNAINLDEARKHGVVVSNVPAYSTPAVAQMTFALLLELCLHASRHSETVMDGDWVRGNDSSLWKAPNMELAGKRMGIIGMGSIGQAVGRIARGFNMEVVFANRSPKPHLEDDSVHQVSFDELLSTSDVVSLHVPSSPKTDGMIDAKALERMKDGALLLNVARGTLIDEHAVVNALLSGKLGGFGADVVAAEPMRTDNPFLALRDLNVVITPHIAWDTIESRERLLTTTLDNVNAFMAGHPQNVVG